MANVMEVIEGISAAVANKHHGSGAKIGLRRESEELVQGVSLYDTRVMDGFGVQIHNGCLYLKYNSEVPLIEVHDKNFETDTRRILKDISSFIKDEYKKVTKSSLRLTEYGDIDILVQTVNRRTAIVTATQKYEIGNLKDLNTQKRMDSEEASFEDVAKRWYMNVRK
jgi:hypothetical protein